MVNFLSEIHASNLMDRNMCRPERVWSRDLSATLEGTAVYIVANTGSGHEYIHLYKSGTADWWIDGEAVHHGFWGAGTVKFLFHRGDRSEWRFGLLVYPQAKETAPLASYLEERVAALEQRVAELQAKVERHL